MAAVLLSSGDTARAQAAGAPLKGQNFDVLINEDANEGIASVFVNNKRVTPNMDFTFSIGNLGTIQPGTVNVSDPKDNVSLSDTFDIVDMLGGNKTASILLLPKVGTNPNKFGSMGFDSDVLETDPAKDTETALVRFGGGKATYTITSPGEAVPEPGSLTLLGIGAIFFGCAWWRRKPGDRVLQRLS